MRSTVVSTISKAVSKAIISFASAAPSTPNQLLSPTDVVRVSPREVPFSASPFASLACVEEEAPESEVSFVSFEPRDGAGGALGSRALVRRKDIRPSFAGQRPSGCASAVESK